MECECLLETEGRGDGRGPLGTRVALTHAPLPSRRLSLQQEQWMNVRVGDIIKLENNQFVAVRDQPPCRPVGASFSLAQRDECPPSSSTRGGDLSRVGSGVSRGCVSLAPFQPRSSLGPSTAGGGGEGARGLDGRSRSAHGVLTRLSAGGPPAPVQQRAPRAVLHRDSGARRVSLTLSCRLWAKTLLKEAPRAGARTSGETRGERDLRLWVRSHTGTFGDGDASWPGAPRGLWGRARAPGPRDTLLPGRPT